MIKVLFICHGNICRSPMAEFMLKDLVKKRGMERDFLIASSATSAEEIGNPVPRHGEPAGPGGHLHSGEICRAAEADRL